MGYWVLIVVATMGGSPPRPTAVVVPGSHTSLEECEAAGRKIGAVHGGDVAGYTATTAFFCAPLGRRSAW